MHAAIAHLRMHTDCTYTECMSARVGATFFMLSCFSLQKCSHMQIAVNKQTLHVGGSAWRLQACTCTYNQPVHIECVWGGGCAHTLQSAHNFSPPTVPNCACLRDQSVYAFASPSQNIHSTLAAHTNCGQDRRRNASRRMHGRVSQKVGPHLKAVQLPPATCGPDLKRVSASSA